MHDESRKTPWMGSLGWYGLSFMPFRWARGFGRALARILVPGWSSDQSPGFSLGFFVGLSLSILVAVFLVGSCAKAGPYFDVTAPVVLEVCGQRLSDEPLVLSPFESIEIRFSEDLDPDSVEPEGVVLVASEDLASCSRDEDCQRQAPGRFVRCIQGGCQASVVDRAFVKDAGSTALSAARAAMVVPALVEASGRTVTVTPVGDLDPNRLYDLVIPETVTDLAANPLIGSDGRPGTWVSLRTSDPLASCTRAALVRPSPGLTQAPTNLDRIMLVVEQAVAWDLLESITLEQAMVPGGERLSWRQVACPPTALLADLTGDATGRQETLVLEGSPGNGQSPVPDESRACYEADLSSPLLSGAKYQLVAPPPGRDGARTGRCLDMGHLGWFAAGRGPQEEEARIVQSDLVQRGPCAELVLGSSTPVEWVLRAWPRGLEGGSDPLWTSIRLGQSAMWRVGFDPDSLSQPISLVVTATDLWGQSLSAGPFALSPQPGPRVVLTEVLANPAGPEPDQEFVELLNLGDESVSLSGWALASAPDGEDAQTISEGLLEPGGFAVLVGPGFDPLSVSDPAVAPGALVIHLDKNLTGNGLSNSGEALYLLDGFGQVVSAYDQPMSVSAGRYNGVSVERTSRQLCASGPAWQANPEGRSSPGAPNDSWQ